MLVENSNGLVENQEKLVENNNRLAENDYKVTENSDKVIEKVTERAKKFSIKVTENRISIIREIYCHPSISKAELSKTVGISVKSISENIDVMRDKLIRRIGPDKGGKWEVVID